MKKIKPLMQDDGYPPFPFPLFFPFLQSLASPPNSRPKLKVMFGYFKMNEVEHIEME